MQKKNLKLKVNFNKNLLGFNYRLTELQASIGIEQLKKIDFLIKKK